MHMLLMLGILAAVFFTAIILMCFFREKLNTRLLPLLFLFGCAVCFFCWNYAAYERGWLEDGFMTLENISPYICTVILFTPFLNEKVREYAYAGIAYLAFGMFLALFISPGAEYVLNFRYTANFMHISEATCHLLMALYGFYLILSNKVTVNLKNLGKSAVFIYASIAFGVFLNWCFHLGNFGMNMYGNYSIYFLDIFGSFGATFVAYLVGVLGTLFLGYLAAHFLDWISRPAVSKDTQDGQHEEPAEESVETV